MKGQNMDQRSGPDASQRALTMVQRAFQKGKWQVSIQQQLGDQFADVVIDCGQLSYQVVVRAIPRGSSGPLEDVWSRACLQARYVARDKGLPLAIVVGPRVSQSAVGRLKAYAERYAPEVAWGVMDHLGLREFGGAGLESLRAEPNAQPGPALDRPAVPKNLFSDLNQWLLKVLLAPELPERLLAAPRGEYRNASALAAAARCSVMSAHRFVEELRNQGLLDEEGRRLRLVRRGELFRRWVNVRSHSLPDMPLRMLIRRDLREHLDKYFPRRRAALGLFAAADELGIGFVSGVPPYVLVDRPSVLPGGSDAPDAGRELVECKPGEPPDVIIRSPKAVKSVFRGMVRPKGIPCCDIIQVWLDVSHHEARGAEQAELIRREYLRDLIGDPDAR